MKLPDMLTNPIAKQSYIINGQEYIFVFRWTDGSCTLDIYTIQNGERKYMLKGRALTVQSDLRTDLPLYLVNKYGLSDEPVQENFHTDFELVFY